MKRLLAVSAISCFLLTPARADHVGLYIDATGTCNRMMPLPPPHMNPVYVVQKFNPGAAAVMFRIQDASGLFPVSQYSPYGMIGVWNDGSTISFGTCVVGDHVVLVLNFFWLGNPLVACNSRLDVVAAPGSPVPGSIAVADCEAAMRTATGGSFYFAPAENGCGDVMGCGVVPVRASTWGGVKALYR